MRRDVRTLGIWIREYEVTERDRGSCSSALDGDIGMIQGSMQGLGVNGRSVGK